MRNGFAAGALGALTTNVLHELLHRALPDAPRVDLLGMQALSKLVSAIGEPPKGRPLYLLTLAGDLVSNSAYLSMTSWVPRKYAVNAGLLIGATAGIGAVVLPGPLGLCEMPTNRTTRTKAITIALYTVGGLVTGLALRE